MKTRSMYKAERMSSDRISTLPQPILDTILCLLLTEEAARTSILSREWRYKWTNIPTLRFDVGKRTSNMALSTMKSIDMHDLHRLLLLHQGPIQDFTLFIEDYWEHYDCFEFDQIILHLSRKHTVKDLTLDGSKNICYKLPKSVFELHHLTDLYLYGFDIDHPSKFNGFSKLGRLDLSVVKISTKTLLHLLSNCPSLKNLSLRIEESGDKCTINELLKCLPVIEHLTISGVVSKWLVIDSVPQELLIHLKDLSFVGMCLIEGFGLALLLAMIKCSPNLEKMHLEMDRGLEFSAVKAEYYSGVWLEHLNVLDVCFRSAKLQTEVVKFILARSPKLEKVGILTVVDREQELKMFETLLRAPHASSAVRISSWLDD